MLAPFRAAGPWAMMIWASLVTAIFALIVIRLTANREALRRAKGRQTARALELLLFKDDLIVSFGAVGRLLAAVLAYQKRFLVPLLLMLVPVVLLMIQLAGWFEARPLRPGETALVKAVFKAGTPVQKLHVAMGVSDHIAIEAGPLRIPAANEITWRIAARAEGAGVLDLIIAGAPIRKHITVSTGPARISPRRVSGNLWTKLSNPGEAPIPDSLPLTSFEIRYPPAQLMLGSLHIHWIAAFFVLTLVFGALLKRPFGAEF
ncbi:MAG: hypothetical protein BWK77_09190 [Verrucomicrobia bacterium A1]|nr:MAG: hypothetical protein BWK77_09190 [Verrucomicrobia bacterium A1]